MGKFIDLSREKFGEWTVIDYAGKSYWNCTCSCSPDIVRKVHGKSLRNGSSTSCGCLRRVNIEGEQFGDWLVLKQMDHQDAICKCLKCNEIYTIRICNLKSGSSTKCNSCARKEIKYAYKDSTDRMFGNWKPLEYQGNQKWLCECQCENKTRKIVSAGDLKRGQTQSCGCSQLKNLIKEDIKATVIEYLGHGIWKCKCKYCDNIYKAHRTYLLDGKDNCGCKTVENRNRTLYDRYGDYSTSRIHNPRTLEQQEAVQDKEALQSFIFRNFKKIPTIYELSVKLSLSADRTLKIVHKFELDDSVIISAGSSLENEIHNFLLEYLSEDEIVQHDREILKPKELDFYIPSKKLAIEVNGVFWHSDEIKGKYFHQYKTIECNKKGIRLIHIFEHEWKYHKEKIKRILKNIICTDNEVIYARNTEVKRVCIKDAKAFCEKYHLQNWVDSSIRIGCYHNNELIGLIAMSKPRFNNNYDWEITRLCWSKKVVGGTEKLFKEILEKYSPESIITYSDISKFTGNIYLKLGFNLVQSNPVTVPNYKWIHAKDFTIVSRYKSQKHILVENKLGTEDQTEDEIMKSLGYLKVYDSGNIKLEWFKQ